MPHEILLATETDLRETVQLNGEIIDCIENAFAQFATSKVIMPPVLSMALKEVNAEVDIKTAYVPGLEGFAIKVSPGFFNNPSLGLPSLNGLMVLLSAKTGQVLAVFLDNGYLTDVRTAAAGAVAARHLAPKSVRTVGILGTGVQARLQLLAASKVRSFEKVLVWGREPRKAMQFAEEMAGELGIATVAADNADLVVAGSQLVITTTAATKPLFSARSIHPGLHITAMGSDQESKNEIEPAVLAQADLVVCDRISQCEVLGELRSALETGALANTASVVEIAELVSGNTPGRTSDDQITICDLTGTGVQDTAIASLALNRIKNKDIGTKIRT